MRQTGWSNLISAGASIRSAGPPVSPACGSFGGHMAPPPTKPIPWWGDVDPKSGELNCSTST